MPITKELALKIIKYLSENPSFYFPFKIMCKIYFNDDYVEIDPKTDINLEDYNIFELHENLQNLDIQTTELMSKGFIEKILYEPLIQKDFIFITFEGMTFEPNSESDVPDIENMQVIGFEEGFNMDEAFDNLKKNQKHLADTAFDEIIGIELRSKKFNYYNLKPYK